MKKITTPIIAALMIVLSSSSMAQADKKALEILQQSNDAIAKTTSTTYEYVYKGHGKYNGHFKGVVRLKGKFPAFTSYLVLDYLDDQGKTIKTEEIAVAGGMNIQLIDHQSKELKEGTMTGGSSHLTSYSYYATLFQYVSPMPFQAELNDPSVKYEGEATVNGVECEIVSSGNRFGDRQFWYIGKKDRMLHAQKSENDDPDEGGGFYFETKKLTLNSSIPEHQLKIDMPTGYKRIDEDNREITVGTEAPGWFLKNLDDQPRRALDYKGQVVVLDFWASWCKPCWSIMPVINEVQMTYDEKDVKVFGVNVWEKKGLDVKAYLKKKGLDHYETLVDTDARTAKKYKIFALPLVVVIGKDGKIKYMSGAGTKDLKHELNEAIKEATGQ